MIAKKDLLWGTLVFLVAFLLRVPFFWYPDSVVFDEGIYATYISNIVYDRPYFELHPPLPNLIMASVARTSPFTYVVRRGTGVPFGDFPFVVLRFINVLLGSLLAVLAYSAARFLWRDRYLAVLSGLGIAFDNALITYARTFLPDTLLVTCGMAGIVMYLWYERRGGVAHLLLASIFLGLAFATKWIGLAFLGTVFLASLWHKKYKDIAIVIAGAAMTYIVVFFIFFGQFSGGFLADRFSFDAVPALAYPAPWDIGETISFLPTYTKLMYEANYTVDRHRYASPPWEWPLGQGAIGMWDRNDRFIVLSANIFGWGTVVLGILFAIILVFFGRLAGSAYFVLAGYLISFIPFFIIGRPFFMYHYFMALVFGWLLVPWAACQLRDMLMLNRDNRKILVTFLMLLLAGFFLAFPTTYGI